MPSSPPRAARSNAQRSPDPGLHAGDGARRPVASPCLGRAGPRRSRYTRGALLSHRNFFGRPPRGANIDIPGATLLHTLDTLAGPGCLNGSIRGVGSQASHGALPPHRWPDDDHPALSTKAGDDARRPQSARFPLMTQFAMPSGAEDESTPIRGGPAKKFRYSAHSGPAATRRPNPALTQPAVETPAERARCARFTQALIPARDHD